MELSHAIFAAGCFWGVQAAFDAVDGVVSTLAGYTGGTLENPSYERICRGDTNHAEAVLVNFDETIVSYDKLLDIYFASHNPTTLNRQGPDIGTQYRSAIFTANEEQEAAALAKIRQINESGIYRTPVVTQVLPEQTFYPAEEYHQKYLAKRGKSKCSIFDNKETDKAEKDKTDHEWRELLTPEQYRILREKVRKSLSAAPSCILMKTEFLYAAPAVIQFLFPTANLIPAAAGQVLTKRFPAV